MHWYLEFQRGACPIAELLLLPSPRDSRDASGADVVTRLEVSSLGLAPEVVISLERKRASARATVVTLGMPLRESVRPGRVLEDAALPSLGRDFWARTAAVQTKEVDPEIVEEVVRASREAPDCQTLDVLDGTVFVHLSAESGCERRATWISPGQVHVAQRHIVKTYQRISGRHFA